MTEAKHQQPNLFTDPNFVAMTPDSRVALAMLMAQPSHWTVLPGLVDNAHDNSLLLGTQNMRTRVGWLGATANIALWRVGQVHETDLLIEEELARFGWVFDANGLDGKLILRKMGQYIKATNLGQVETWAANWLAIPRGPEREYLRPVITEACNGDVELARRLDDLIRGE